MNNTHDSNQDEPGKEFQRKHENRPELMAEFTKAIEAYGQAASAGQDEQAEAAALQRFCLASEEAERNPSPEPLLAAKDCACEERRAWEEAESCLTSESLNASLAHCLAVNGSRHAVFPWLAIYADPSKCTQWGRRIVTSALVAGVMILPNQSEAKS